MRVIFLFLIFFVGVSASAKPPKLCTEKVIAVAVAKLVGSPPKSEFRVLGAHKLGVANKKLGAIRLDLWTVEIADEADGGVMVVFTTPQKCEVHDVVFGMHALDR